MTVSIQAKAKVEKKIVESANIVASLAGNDPQLKNEYVVLSAHIDHVGIGEPVNGDRIYNGAMDNASGVAVLLDVAASLKRHPENLKRSLLFVFVTGEEKGLLGSKYFAAHPTVDAKSMVANINIDMFRPLVPLKMLTVLGMAESDLGDEARQVAESVGVSVQADPAAVKKCLRAQRPVQLYSSRHSRTGAGYCPDHAGGKADLPGLADQPLPRAVG